MTPLFLLAALAGVPLLLALLFRVNALFVFISVVAGHLLVSYVADDAAFALRMGLKDTDPGMVARIGLQLVPLAISLLLLRKTVSTSKVLLHILPTAASCLALVVFLIPLLPNSMRGQITANQYGQLLEKSQDVVLGAASVLILLLVWLTYRHKEEKVAGKHKK